MNAKQASVHARIFISHSHRDRAAATDLQRVLTKFGAQTFLDQDKIQVADVLPERIREGIEWCDTFLLLWSSSAAASDWVGKEWNTAYELRRKIIPYCLDSTSLPSALENLVYVDRKDAQVAHAGLLRAVFGKAFSPSPTDLFPGRWRVTLNAFGLGTATYLLELRANGQIIGTTKIDQGGVVGNLMQSIDASDLLNLRPSVSGTWEYEEHTEILTLEIFAHGLGQDVRERVQIRATGREVGEIQGKDFSGRTYVIRRLPSSELKQCLLHLEQTLTKFGTTKMTPDTIQQDLDDIYADIDAVEEHRNEVAGLGDAALTEQVDKICKTRGALSQLLAAPKEKFGRNGAEREGLMRGLALVIAKQVVPEVLKRCFPDD